MKVNKDHIKKALDSKVPAWDKEELWKGIESKLPPQKKKRRPILLWFLFAGFLTAIILSNALYTSIRHKLFGPVQSYETQAATYPQQSEIKSGSTPYTESPNRETAYSTPNPDYSESNPTNESNISISVKDGEQTMKNQSAYASVFKPTPTASVNTITSDNEKTNSSGQTLIHDIPDPLPSKPANPAMEHVSTYTSLLPTLQIHLKWEKQVNTPWIYSLAKPKSSPSWKIGFTSGIALLQSKVATHRAENNVWINEKSEVNQPKESISFGINLQKNISSKWWLGFGLQYLQMNEVLIARDAVTTVKTIQSDSAQYVNANSGIVYIPGYLQQTQTKGYDIYSPNKWTRWTIPISVSYQFRWGRLQIAPSGHLSYTLQQSFQGIQIHPDGKYIYKDMAVFNTLYKNTGIMSWGLRLESEYPLTHHLSLSTSLFYTKDLNSVWNNTYNITEKFTQKGITAGLIYQW